MTDPINKSDDPISVLRENGVPFPRSWSDRIVNVTTTINRTPPGMLTAFDLSPEQKQANERIKDLIDSAIASSYQTSLGRSVPAAPKDSGVVRISSGGDPVPVPSYVGFAYELIPSLELLLNDEKFTDQGPVYRVRATQPIHLRGVCPLSEGYEQDIPAGRLGGYISKDTKISGTAWVGLGATVTASTLENVFLKDGSYHNSSIFDSSLSGVHTVSDSFLKEVYSPEINDSYSTVLREACLKICVVQPGARVESDTFVGMNIPRIYITPNTPFLFATMPSFMKDWKGLPSLNHGVWVGSPSKISILQAYVPDGRAWTTAQLHTIQAKLSSKIKSSSQGRMIDAFFTTLGQNILDLD